MSHFKAVDRFYTIGAVTLSLFLFILFFLIAGCGSKSGGSSAEATSKSRTGVAARTVTLNVEGMTCGGCAVSVKMALKKLDGVQDTKVDVKKAQMVQAVEKVGYKASKPSEVIKS